MTNYTDKTVATCPCCNKQFMIELSVGVATKTMEQSQQEDRKKAKELGVKKHE